MYMPPAFRVEDQDQVRSMISARGFGHLVTTTADENGRPAFEATPLPFVLRGDDVWSVAGHLARQNTVARFAGSALVIVGGADTYVSPSWYPSKKTDGRVVPTWNYEAIYLHGELVIHDDPTWMREQIIELTDRQEAAMPTPWSVADAPDEFIDRQIRGIIGVELVVDHVEAKRKLSQNRSNADRLGVLDGLTASPHGGAALVRAAMDHTDT